MKLAVKISYVIVFHGLQLQTGTGAFFGWRAALSVENQQRAQVYSRLVLYTFHRYWCNSSVCCSLDTTI